MGEAARFVGWHRYAGATQAILQLKRVSQLCELVHVSPAGPWQRFSWEATM